MRMYIQLKQKGTVGTSRVTGNQNKGKEYKSYLNITNPLDLTKEGYVRKDTPEYKLFEILPEKN